MDGGFKNFPIVSYSYEEAINRCSFVFPGDLIVEILQRLPVKSLLRFESISKPWQLVIRNSKFIAKHLLHHQKQNNNKKEINYLHLYNRLPAGCCYDFQPFFLCYCPPDGISLISNRGYCRVTSGPAISHGILLISNRDDGNIITRALCHSPLHCGVQCLTIVGSCNGLVCIKFYYGSSTSTRNYVFREICYGIWNPATRKFKLLPTPQPISSSEFCNLSSSIVGFSYIPCTCSYKLVQILVFSYKQAYVTRYSASVEMLNMGENSWREVVCQGQDEVMHELGLKFPHLESTRGYVFNHPVVAKGCLHWLGMLQNGGVILVSFDLDKEVFTQSAIPYKNDYHYIKLTVFENNLAAFVSQLDDEIGYYYEVWIYEGTSQSWTKQFSFKLLLEGGNNLPVGFWADGKIIVRSESPSSWGSEQYLYNPNNQEKKNFPCNDKNCNFLFEPYIESLVDF